MCSSLLLGLAILCLLWLVCSFLYLYLVSIHNIVHSVVCVCVVLGAISTWLSLWSGYRKVNVCCIIIIQCLTGGVNTLFYKRLHFKVEPYHYGQLFTLNFALLYEIRKGYYSFDNYYFCLRKGHVNDMITFVW